MKAIALTAAILAPGAPAIAAPTPDSYAVEHGCKFEHPSADSYRATTRLLRHERPVGPETHRRVHRWAVCVATRRKAHAVHEHVRALWAWRHRYAHRWPIRLNATPSGWVQWARNITFCESRWNRYASNGSHFSYFQWASSTWASASAGFDAPASPYDASWPHQAVIAINWAQVAGTSQWECRG